MLVGSSPELLKELLDEFEQLCRERTGPEVWEDLPGGTPEHEVRSALADVGLVAPDELVVLFGWRSGVDRYPPKDFPHPIPSLSLPTLQQAVDAYLEWLDMIQSWDDPEERKWATWGWGEGWFPLSLDNWRVVIDCSPPGDRPPLVRNAIPEFPIDEDPPSRGQIVSLCTYVNWLIEGIHSGGLLWDAALRCWVLGRNDAIPAAQRAAGFVGGA